MEGARIRATIYRLDNATRKLWIHNDSGLWDWWRSSKQQLDQFISDNSSEIDKRVAELVTER